MRVTIINRHYSDVLGGSELQCDFLARGLISRGHWVTYVAPMKIFKEAGYPYELRAVRNDSGVILSEVLESRPDVVYWRYNLHQFRKVASGLGRASIPMVFAVSHMNDVLPWLWSYPSKGLLDSCRQLAKRRWNRVGFRYVKAVTTNNRDYLLLSPVANAYYVPNGMSNKAEPFHWPRPYVAWVANIKPAKRPECFVKVTRALAEYGIDGLMVGHIQSNGYDWLADRNRVPDNFHYLGPRTPTQVNGLLAGSLLHVHTCQPEGFPNIFIQAWMQGRPSVSLEFDPCGYIEEQGIGAVSGGDVNVFENQVVRWATRPDMVNQAGQRARDFSNAAFSLESMVAQVERILESVI